MSATGLEVFDTTLQKTNSWLKELMGYLGWHDRHRAYLALRATLHSLRDRLTIAESAQLAAQLPMLVRGIYYEGWNPSRTPLKIRTKDDFLMGIEEQFLRDGLVDADAIARAVFRVLETRITQGEIENVKHVLPEDIRALWPQPSAASAARPISPELRG